VLIHFLYTTSHHVQSLGPVRVSSDQILGDDSHFLFPLKRQEILVSPISRYQHKSGCDAIQTSKDPLEVLVGPIKRLRAKRFKEAFNRLLQDTWAKVDFKRILNNKKEAIINLIHVQKGLIGGT